MSALLGLVVGLVLGLTGAGGSVFAVPLLMFGLGWSLTEAAPVALLAVGAAATFGTVVAWDVTYVRYRAALLMGGVGLLAAPLGVMAARELPERQLALAFAAVLVIVALRMFAQVRRRPDEAAVTRAAVSGDGSQAHGHICNCDTRTGRIVWTRSCAALLSAIGAGTGFASGLLGVGGGLVIVPALRAGSALSIHSAVATSLMAIAVISAGTSLMHFATAGAPPWAVALPFVGGALAGMLAGRRLAPRIAGPVLQQAFAVSMLVVAGLMVLGK